LVKESNFNYLFVLELRFGSLVVPVSYMIGGRKVVRSSGLRLGEMREFKSSPPLKPNVFRSLLRPSKFKLLVVSGILTECWSIERIDLSN